MDITNKIVKICRRITAVELELATKTRKCAELRAELETLTYELSTLHPAVKYDEA